MKTYRYTLQPYKGRNTRYTCPQCRHKDVFVRYIDTTTGEHLSEDVGRCNREQQCGYHMPPSFEVKNQKEKSKNIFTNPKKQILHPNQSTNKPINKSTKSHLQKLPLLLSAKRTGTIHLPHLRLAGYGACVGCLSHWQSYRRQHHLLADRCTATHPQWQADTVRCTNRTSHQGYRHTTRTLGTQPAQATGFYTPSMFFW